MSLSEDFAVDVVRALWDMQVEDQGSQTLIEMAADLHHPDKGAFTAIRGMVYSALLHKYLVGTSESKMLQKYLLDGDKLLDSSIRVANSMRIIAAYTGDYISHPEPGTLERLNSKRDRYTTRLRDALINLNRGKASPESVTIGRSNDGMGGMSYEWASEMVELFK